MIDLSFSEIIGGEPVEDIGETDQKFRDRILALGIRDRDVVSAVQIACGRALDILGKAHGLYRNIGPFIESEE